MTAQAQVEPGSIEWLRERQKYLGASEVAAALGLSKFKGNNPIKVYESKFGEPRQIEDEDTLRVMHRGTVLESVIIRAYEIREGKRVAPSEHVIHPGNPWMACTPDGLVDEQSGVDSKGILQAKTSFLWAKDGWGEEYTDDIPSEYFMQEVFEMAVTGREWADVAVLFADDDAFDLLVKMKEELGISDDVLAGFVLQMDFRVYSLTRDIDIEDGLISAAKEFWFDHVVAQVLPADVATMKDTGGIRKATLEEADRINDLKSVYLAHADLGKELEEIKEEIRHVIGEDSGIESVEIGRVTWKKSKDSVKEVTDWEAIAIRLAECVAADGNAADRLLNSMKADYTREVIKEGSRRLVLPTARWKKEAAE